ncbi:hypothetical protein [Acinetobacter nematophilus]|uniref:Uncharacterized protein n=1 Tax=Acinetobacter nematophilus TaxID=2994642 RepID=A0A9X3IHG1_9GAMM|nr:hypothetical protein [Acinetobacter nematophilus]MCX5468126.1 hypothetical protein [Acinetobacter nematophilus]
MERTDLTLYALYILRLNQLKVGDLSPYGHWVLLRFILAFGTHVCSMPLQELANKIGVQHKKLRRVLEELQQSNLITVSYPEQGKRARVRHIRINHEHFLGGMLSNGTKNTEYHKRAIGRLKQRLALYPMIERLFDVIQTISTSELKQESKLDFKSALLLLTLLTYSNQFGIVMGCGNVEIYKSTGLKKQSIYKYLYRLMYSRFIRSRAEGSIRNAFISLEDPIFSLNLSHTLWGEAAIYGRFYIIEYPEKHQFEVKRLAYVKHRISRKIKKENSDVENQNFLCDPISYLFKSERVNRDSFVQYQQEEYDLLSGAVKELSEQDADYLKLIRFDHLGAQELKKIVYSYNQGDVLLQCYLEQHCCELYCNEGSVYKQLLQGASVRLEHQGLMALFAGKKYYREVITDTQFDVTFNEESYNKYLLERQLKEIRQASFDRVLMSMLDLIAFNQIYLYFKLSIGFEEQERITNKKYRVLTMKPPFRILPRSMEQTRYSCIFVPDIELKEDRFFHGKVKVQIEQSLQINEAKSISILSQQITPSDEELEQYGILSSFANDKFSIVAV